MIPFLHPNRVREDLGYLAIVCLISPLISFFVSVLVFPRNPSYPFLFLIILQIIPYVFSFFEEETSRLVAFFKISDFDSIRKDIFRIIKFFSMYFLMIFLSLLFLFVILPENLRGSLFKVPMDIISYLRGRFSNGDILEIIRNNMIVLITTFFISLIYLTGSTFVVTWNSSILACLIGEIILKRKYIEILGYFLHGFPEIFSYILAGISGAIFSMTLSKRYEKVFLIEFLRMSLIIILLSVLLLLFSFGIEVGVSPFFLKR